MLAEAPLEHSQAVLLVGQAPEALRDRLASAAPTRPVLEQTSPYGAAAVLLRTVHLPAAVVVFAETLRGDELRFFDFLARRWPSLPVAAAGCAAGRDRRLDVCRRKGVPVIEPDDIADWLTQSCPPIAVGPQPVVEPRHPGQAAPQPARHVVMPLKPAAPIPAPVAPMPLPQEQALPLNADHEDIQDELDAEAPSTDAESNEPADPETTASRLIHQMPEDSFVDLPDELVAQLPDQSDDDVPEEAPERPDLHASLEDELPPLDDEERQGQPQGQGEQEYRQDLHEPDEKQPDDADQAKEGDLHRLPLTPWSDVHRPARKRPVRRPPKSSNEPPPAPQNPAPQRPASRPQGNLPPPDYGLLTPEELRALLQDPQEGDGRQGGQP